MTEQERELDLQLAEVKAELNVLRNKYQEDLEKWKERFLFLQEERDKLFDWMKHMNSYKPNGR